MKQKMKILAAALLAFSMLAGCASNNAAENTETNSQAVPETIIWTPETLAATEPPESEAFTEALETTAATEAFAETEPAFTVQITPVITQPQNQITVTTADEFLDAIAPDTEIIVDAELIDWSTANGYGTENGEYYRWEDPFDGPELIITGVSNLTIRGAGEDHTANVLSAVPRYAYVVMFENCSNIHVKGLTVGHTEEPGSCRGGVLGFRNSQDILVEDCGLYGCGTIGVMGESSKNMQIINNDIYECSVAGVEFSNCKDINVDGNTIRDIGDIEANGFPGTDFRVFDSENITCNGEIVHGSFTG